MSSFYKVVGIIKPWINEPSVESYSLIKKYFSTTGIKTYFDRELLKSDLISWYKVFKEIDYFVADNFPKSDENNSIAFWDELNFLEQISRNFGTAKYDEIEEDFLIMVDDFIDYLNTLSAAGTEIHTHNDWILFTIIQNFDKNRIKIKHIEFMDQAIARHKQHSLIVSEINKSFLSKILQCDDEIISTFYNILFTYDVIDDSYGNKISSRVEEYWLKEILEKSIKLLNFGQSKLLLNLLLQRLKTMVKEQPFEFSTFKIPSIEDSDQRRDYDKSITLLLVDFIRNLFERQEGVNIRSDVSMMLASKESILKRIAIHLINYFFCDLRDLFFDYSENLVENSEVSHEIFVLFETQKNEFSKEEALEIVRLIDSQDFSHLEEDEDNEKYGEFRKAYRKRKYLYALKDSSVFPMFKVKFEEYDSMLSTQDEHPAFDSYWSGVQRLGLNSPKTMEQIKEMTTVDFIQYIQEEFVEDKSEFNGPTHGALSEELSSIIITDPSFYIEDLHLLSQLNEHYFYKIIDAYKKCLQANKSIDIEKILEYMMDFLSQHIESDGIKYWYVSSPIADFIKEISSSDRNHNINDDLHSKILNLLIQADTFILNANEEDEQRDYISHMLNAPKGQLFSSMLIYSLKYTRDNKLDTDRWIPEIKDLFSKKLLEDKSIDIFTVIGYYLPNISYLDDNWLEDNYKNIFGKDIDDNYWEASMSGYLHNSTLYLKLYDDVCKTGSFIRGLDYKFSDSDSRQFVKFICIAFNSDYESIDNSDSMINKLVSTGDEKQLKEAINFFHNRVNNDMPNLENTLKPFWKKTLSEVISKNYQNLHVELMELITTVEVIDEDIYTLMITSIDKVDFIDAHSFWILDSFIRLLSNSFEYIAQIYIQLLRKNSFSTYDIEKIEEVIDYFYQHDLKKEADELCNLYGEYGEYRLEDLYRKYQDN